MRELKDDVMRYADYELVVKELRSHGAMTTGQVAKRLGWKTRKAASGIYRGRLNKVIVPIEANARFTHEGRARVFEAAHVPGWPLPADDTQLD